MERPDDELCADLGRAKQGKTEALFRAPTQLDKSIDSFVHAPGDRGLVMIVFTLPSHDLGVFKVIRDKSERQKPRRAPMSSNATIRVPARRAGRLVDAQEFQRCGFLAPLHAGAGRVTAARGRRKLAGSRAKT